MAKVELNKSEKEMIMSTPDADKNMYLESMLKRFKKQVANQEIMEDCKKHEFFLKKSLRRKEKSRLAKIKLIKENRGISRRKLK